MTGLSAVLAVVASMVAVVLFSAAPAGAATPGIVVTDSAPTSVLYGSDATISLTLRNNGAANGYNVAVVDVLPAGVSYVPGSATPSDLGDPSSYVDPITAKTSLYWANATDLAPNATYVITFQVKAAVQGQAHAILPGVAYTDSATAYIESDARTVVKFSATAVPGNYTASSGVAVSSRTTITPMSVTKSENSPESELPRGVHDHKATYTITVTNTTVAATNSIILDDYLPAGLEFLGCGGADNTTNAPTNLASRTEYPGAPLLSAGATLTSGCPAPTSVTTEALNPSAGDGSEPVQPVVAGSTIYTHVQWTVGNLPAGASTTIKYLAAVPLRENVAMSSPAGSTLQQGSNLDNNSGAETVDGQSLTNLAIASGTFQGTLGAGSNPVSASGDTTVEAVDLAVQKTVDESAFTQAGRHLYTLRYQTSEYRYASNVVVTDTLPDGLCPAGDSAAIECSSDTRLPSLPYSSVTNNAGVYTLTWNLAGRIPADTDATITVPTDDRTAYTGDSGAPTVAGDSLTNNVSITGTVTAVCTDGTAADKSCTTTTAPTIYSGENTPRTATNASRAGEATGEPVITKRIAQRATGAVNCATASYVTTPAPTYTRGDTICFQLEVDFPNGLNSRNPVVTDLLPLNTTYVANSAVYATGNTVRPVTPDASQTGALIWTLADYQNGADNFVNPGAVFLVDLAVTATSDPSAGNAFDLTGNLMKLTQTNTAGTAISLRAQVNYDLGQPLLGVTHGVQQVNSGTVNGPNVDGVPVHDGDSVVYRVDITNSGAVPAQNTAVHEVLPTQITSCAAITAISDGGVCSILGGKPVIDWTSLPGPIAALGGTKTLTYTVALPSTLAGGEKLTSTASITGYQNVPENGGSAATYAPGVNGVPAASDPTNVFLASPTLAKSIVTTSVNETGNNTASQATIGETISYQVVATVPAGTTLYNGKINDPLTKQSYVAGSLKVNGSSVLPTGYTTTTSATNVQLVFPSSITAGATPVAITLTFDVLVLDTPTNVRSGTVTNAATMPNTDSTGAALTPISSNTTSATIVEPNIVVSKSDSVNHSAAPGTAVTYSVTVADSNAVSNVSTAHNVVVVDSLPPNMSQPTTISNGGVVSGSITSGFVITWTLPTLAPSAPAAGQALTYVSSLPNPTTAGDTFQNSVTATATSLDPTTFPGARTSADAIAGYAATGSDTVTVPVAVVTSKVANPASVTIGQDTTYTVTATVPANVVLPNAAVIDTLPDGLTFDTYGTCASTDGTTCQGLPTPTKAANGQTRLAWFLGDLTSSNVARTITITYSAYVSASYTSGGARVVAGASLLNSAGVYWNATAGTDPTTIPDPAAYTRKSTPASATVTVVEPNLSLVKSTPITSPVPGQPIGYTVKVTNTGTSTAFDVVVTDPIPAGLNDPTAISNGGVYNAGTRAITWNLASETTTTPVSLTYNAMLAVTNAKAGVAIANTASAAWDGVAGVSPTDPRYRQYGPTSSTATVTPVLPHIVLAKVAQTGNAVPNVSYTWTITITDTTAASAQGVSLNDTLPPNWSFNGGSVKYNGVSGADPTSSGQNLVFNVPGTVVSGGPVTLTYTATPATTAATGPTANTNSVVGTFQDATGSSASGNGAYQTNSATANAFIPSVDVSIVKTASGAIVPGQPSAWSIKLHNSGPSIATGPLVVVDTLPAGATAPGCSSGWTASIGTGTIACTKVASIAIGGDDNTLTITLTLPSSTTGNVTNAASVTTATYDPNTSNNASSVTTAVTPQAHLVITKTHIGPFIAGGQGAYTVGVHNLGPSDDPGPFTVTDTLPAGMTFVSGSVSWTCSGTTSVSCVYSSALTSGSDATALTLVVAVDPSVTAASLTNSASVASPLAPMNPTVTDPTAITTSADVAIVKTHNAPFTSGQDATYTIGVRNNGPSDAAGPITVSDQLPAGETFASGSAPWTCSATAGQLVTCTLAGPLANATAATSITLTVHVGSGVTTALVNTATVSSPTADPDSSNNSSTDNSQSPSISADLRVAKVATTASFTAGSNGTYILTVTNDGPADAAGPITVTDSLPSGETFVSTGGTGWNCSATGQDVTCTAATTLVAAHSLPVITLTVHIPADEAAGSLDNRAHASSPTPDVAGLNDSGDVFTPVVTSASLTIAKTHTGAFTPGTNGTYTLAVANAGPSDAATVVVRDSLPSGETYVSATGTTIRSGASVANWTCAADSSQVLTCSLDKPMPAGTNTTITVTVHVASGYVGSTIVNTATLSTSTPTNGGSLSSTDTVTAITPSADLRVTKTHAAALVAGGNATYTLTISDLGPSDAGSPVTVTDTLPNGLSFVSASGPTGSAWNCTGTAGSPTITCTLGAGLVAGSSADPITVVAFVDHAVTSGTTLTNHAQVSSPTSDPTPANNQVDDPAAVTTSADLGIVKAHSGAITPGAHATYTLSVHNYGASDATAVTVTDTLPTGLTYVSAGAASGWSCGASGATVTCTLAGLAAGADAPVIDLVVAVDAAAYPVVSNSASVHSATPDPMTTNNSSTDAANVTPVSTLAIAKTHAGEVDAGGSVTYTITVSNSGLTEDTGPRTVTDTLPAGLTYTSATGTGWTCVAAAQIVTCTGTGALATGSSSAFELTAVVAGPATGTLTNTATLTSADDSNATPPSASDPTPITAVATLQLTKRLQSTHLQTGVDATYVLSVLNYGPSATSGTVTITDPLPSGLSFVSADGAGWVCTSAASTITCTTSQVIADGGTAAITLIAKVMGGPGPVVNTATLTSVTKQGGGTTDSATATGVVAPAALAATGEATGTPLLIGLLLLGLGLAFMIIARRRQPATG